MRDYYEKTTIMNVVSDVDICSTQPWQQHADNDNRQSIADCPLLETVIHFRCPASRKMLAVIRRQNSGGISHARTNKPCTAAVPRRAVVPKSRCVRSLPDRVLYTARRCKAPGTLRAAALWGQFQLGTPIKPSQCCLYGVSLLVGKYTPWYCWRSHRRHVLFAFTIDIMLIPTDWPTDRPTNWQNWQIHYQNEESDWLRVTRTLCTYQRRDWLMLVVCYSTSHYVAISISYHVPIPPKPVSCHINLGLFSLTREAKNINLAMTPRAPPMYN